MNRMCKCGGKMFFKDENKFWFRMRCDKCGVTNKQRKRQPKKKGPFGDRKPGERCAKNLVPPFHPKGKDHKDYKSNW